MADAFSRPVFSNTGRLGSSSTHAVLDPSPSLDPRSLGEIGEKDKTRQAGVAALGHAKAVAAAFRPVPGKLIKAS